MLKIDFWVRPRNRSRQLLLIILALGLIAFFLQNSDGVIRFAIIPVILLLGLALALGCLIVFPSADLWKSDGANNEVVNDVRNVLISSVVAAFGLITLFLTYEAANASRISADIAAKEATASRLSDAGGLMGHTNKGIRLAGITSFARLIKEQEITRQTGYDILASYIRSESPWDPEADAAWRQMSDEAKQALKSSPIAGRGSLKKRAPDVQGALSLLTSESKIQVPNGKARMNYRTDLRDANLQGAAFGTSYLQNAILNGAHLDYLDCGVRKGQAKADLSGADLRGASLYGANLDGVNLTGVLLQAPVNEDGSARPEQPTDLSYATLRGANLSGANLRGTTIHQTDFTNASLTGAHLEGANLKGSIGLETADLSDITYDSTTQWPKGVSVP